jgi:hypothetical protein
MSLDLIVFSAGLRMTRDHRVPVSPDGMRKRHRAKTQASPEERRFAASTTNLRRRRLAVQRRIGRTKKGKRPKNLRPGSPSSGASFRGSPRTDCARIISLKISAVAWNGPCECQKAPRWRQTFALRLQAGYAFGAEDSLHRTAGPSGEFAHNLTRYTYG